MPDFSTLEQAQAEILRLSELVETLTTEKETLSQNNKTLSGDLDNARALNRKLFAQLPVYNSKQEEPEEPETPPTCEEFAKTITI